jgi:hypothetical protein
VSLALGWIQLMDLFWLQELYFPTIGHILLLGASFFAGIHFYRLLGLKSNCLVILPNQTVWSKNKSVQLAQFKIYGLSFFVVALLFCSFSALNFWTVPFPASKSPAVEAGRIMLAYLNLSIGLVLPLFFSLQVALKQKIESATFRACVFTAQPFLHLFIFITAALLTIPWLEAPKAILGQSILNPEGVAFFLGMAACGSILPGISFGAINLLKSPSTRYSFVGVSFKDIIREQKLLESEDFSIALLENKTDSEITFLIKLAKYAGNLEQADLISQYLLTRHSTEIEPQRQTLS